MERVDALDGRLDGIAHRGIDRRLARGDQDLVDGDSVEALDLFGDEGVSPRTNSGDHLGGDAGGVVA